jgi:hypothetical protein
MNDTHRVARRSGMALALIILANGTDTFALPRQNGGTTSAEARTTDITAYVLTGPALDSKTVTINGLSIDPSSVDSTRASVARVFSSNYPDGPIVREVKNESADLAIDYSAPGVAVPDVYYGVNVQIASKEFLAMPLYRELVSHLRIDIARFPAGQERVRYDRDAPADSPWRLGAQGDYEFLLTGKDVENFASLCRENGIKAEWQLNLANDDPAMWTRMADQVVNGLKLPIEYFSVGNEPDISPTGNWKYLGANTRDEAIAEYAARYARYRSALRAIAPNASFVLGELSCNREPELSAILGRVLDGAGSSPPEALSAHWYLLGDWGEPKSHPEYPSIEHLSVDGNRGNNVRRLQAIRDSLKAASDARAPGARIFIGEWGASWSATPGGVDVLDTLATALYVAETLEYGKTVGVDSMEYFSLSDPASFSPWNSAMIAMDGEKAILRPQYYVRAMHKYAWGNRTIPVPGGQTGDLSVYASREGEVKYLMLINRTAGPIDRVIAAKTAVGEKRYRVRAIPRSMTIAVLP